MSIRTDLISEQRELHTGDVPGAVSRNETIGDVRVSRVDIENEQAAKAFSKPRGSYFTLEFEKLDSMADTSDIQNAVISALSALLPENRESVLVAGLGNADITPDALGPKTVDGLLVTRHIGGKMRRSMGLEGLKSVSAIVPGVLGKTGIEASELVSAAIERTRPSAVIAVDALAARRPSRLCSTIQLTDTGISPGSGVHNSRRELSRAVFGIPVVAIGMPTVVDAATYRYDSSGDDADDPERSMMVTPKEIDSLIKRASEILAMSLNVFLQPELTEEIIAGLI